MTAGGYVYFIKVSDDGPIKIGRTADRHARQRLCDLQIGNPYPLRLIGAIPGGAFEEQWFHRNLSRHRDRCGRGDRGRDSRTDEANRTAGEDQVKGSRVTIDGKPAIIAAEIRKGSELLKLRDENGVPVWAGCRKR